METLVLAFVAGGALGAGLVLWRRGAALDAARGALARAGADAARLRAELEHERKSVALLQQTEARLKETFHGLSAEALRQNNQAFLDLATNTLGQFQQAARTDLDTRQAAIADLLQPVNTSFERLRAAIGEVEKLRVGDESALRAQITALASGQHELRAETANLVKALRSPTTRGRWGEIQLRRVCELAGMLEHCDFDEQRTSDGDERRLRPDVQVRMPGGRMVVVDAKAPIQAYLEACEAPDEARRSFLLRDHARQVRDHVTRLCARAYWEQLPGTPDFVVMFLPGEPLLSAAWEHDPGLVEWALEQRVMMATPTTLIALLKAVAWGWRQETLAENARLVSDLGRALHERLLTLGVHFAGMGKGLNQAVRAYNNAVGSLEQRVLVAARRFEDLGVACAEPLPELRPVERVARAPRREPVLFGADD
jgi:DNA recombination protein RmuC